MKRAITAAVIVVVLSAVTFANAQNTVTFDNQSGEPALVKVIGPTTTEVQVPNGAKETVNASAGRYIIKVRYGVPGRYHYSKGQEFEVKETATTASAITITLHKVVAGNYDSRPITEKEFGETSQEEASRTPRVGDQGGGAVPPTPKKPVESDKSKIESADVCYRIFLHLVPQAPKLGDVFYYYVDEQVHAGLNLQLSQNESAERITKLFGKPERIEKAATKTCAISTRLLSPGGSTKVTGDLWIYGPLSLMITDGKVVAIWLEGREHLPKLDSLYKVGGQHLLKQ